MAEPILKTEKVCKWYNAGRNDEIQRGSGNQPGNHGERLKVLYGPSGIRENMPPWVLWPLLTGPFRQDNTQGAGRYAVL